MSSNVHNASHSSAPSHSWRIASNVSSFFKTLVKSKTSSPFGMSCAEQPAPSYTLPLPPQATRLHDRSTIFDDFFLSGMLESRPCRPASQFSSDPPPYTPYPSAIADSDTDVVKEPPTIARMVFFCGFVFFPFWLIGLCILLTPLHPTDGWEEDKTEDEKAQLLQILRATEKKWALRSVYSFFVVLFTIVLAISIFLIETR